MPMDEFLSHITEYLRRDVRYDPDEDVVAINYAPQTRLVVVITHPNLATEVWEENWNSTALIQLKAEP